ncbi:MAG: site-2 protease family protein, partial [Dehalococcoidia bacterium]
MTQVKQSPQEPRSGDGAATVEPAIQTLPELPQLAPGVELSGKMGESGFKDEQWLAQRNGSFVQLTDLLYKVAEQANGQQTIEEMAASVSASYGKKVSSDNIGQLLKQKLMPLGLVAGADGSVAAPQGTAGGAPARSPLAVNMKMALISPSTIDRCTRILQTLFWTPILIAVLLAGAAVLGWLFFVHGIGNSVRNALYQPGLFLAALAVIVLAAAFHELGHASALRRGGGKVRQMGFGIYLIYPAFYTDVSDNYRLGRWARVRTDLGGFYFNLVFALIMMGLYLVTRFEFLLLVIVLIIFDIVRQLMPFVRLDGYWALADLTGIPDFFSHMGAFLRTVLPLPFWKGPKLPNLKTWVKFVYAAYILVTVPLLAFLLFTMVRTLPRLLATAWDSFGKLANQVSQAQAHGDALKMLVSVVQMLTLALPTLGTLFILFTLGRTIVRLILNWSKPSRPRRVVGSLGMAAIVAFLAFLWAPHI